MRARECCVFMFAHLCKYEQGCASGSAYVRDASICLERFNAITFYCSCASEPADREEAVCKEKREIIMTARREREREMLLQRETKFPSQKNSMRLQRALEFCCCCKEIRAVGEMQIFATEERIF